MIYFHSGFAFNSGEDFCPRGVADPLKWIDNSCVIKLLMCEKEIVEKS